jgi:lysozyme
LELYFGFLEHNKEFTFMENLKISPSGINLIKQFEGLHKQTVEGDVRAYRCVAGRWTLGWGHTQGVRSGKRATIEQCEEYLLEDLREVGQYINALVEVPLNQAHFDSLSCFIFNLGGNAFKKSTLLKKLNKGEYDEVPAQLLRWNKARVDGVLTSLPGLTRRRAAEAALFSMGTPLASEENGELMPQKLEVEKEKSLFGRWFKK